jgi:hypothetical protein
VLDEEACRAVAEYAFRTKVMIEFDDAPTRTVAPADRHAFGAPGRRLPANLIHAFQFDPGSHGPASFTHIGGPARGFWPGQTNLSVVGHASTTLITILGFGMRVTYWTGSVRFDTPILVTDDPRLRQVYPYIGDQLRPDDDLVLELSDWYAVAGSLADGWGSPAREA